MKSLADLKQSWRYPGGEIGVRQIRDCDGTLLARIQSSDDLIGLFMWLDAAYRSGGDVPDGLFMPYLPYARQDRVAAEGDPLAIGVLAGLLESVGVRRLETLDIHSEAAADSITSYGMRLVNRSPVPYLRTYLERAGIEPARAVFVAPDAGASGKVGRYAAELGAEALITCRKLRDPETGKLSGFIAGGGPTQLKPGRCLVVVDDICDGGGTFVGVAAALAAHFNTHHPLHLFTSHGIYSHSEGLFPLTYAGYRTIGSTDSFLHGKTDPHLITVPLEEGT